MIDFDIDVNLDERQLDRKRVSSKEEAQFMLDSQVLKDSNYFIPMQTGELMRSGVRHSRPGDGVIKWKTPYARRLYYNPEYNFSHDVNPNARGLWFEHAKSMFRKDWLKVVGRRYAKYFK